MKRLKFATKGWLAIIQLSSIIMNSFSLRVFLILALCSGQAAFAQLAEIESPRHIKGQQGVEGNVGLTKLGKYFNLGYSRNFSNKIYGKLQGGIESGNYKNDMFSFSSYNGDAGVYYAPLNIKRILFMGVNAGLTVNSDQVKGQDIDDLSFINYGFFGGVELEYFLSDKFVVLANLKQKYLLQKVYGTQVFFAGLGVKYVW